MSWDVLVYDFGFDPKPVSEMTDDDRPAILGSPAEVRAKVDAHLQGIDWSDPQWGIYEGEGFVLELSLKSRDAIDGFMVHVRGGGEAVAALLKFAAPNGWSLLDCSSLEWIDSENPSTEGWERFQAFRDRAIESARGEKEPE